MTKACQFVWHISLPDSGQHKIQVDVVIFAWVNDERSLRQRGGKRDPYEVFRRMLGSGHPPNDWAVLMRGSHQLPQNLLRPPE